MPTPSNAPLAGSLTRAAQAEVDGIIKASELSEADRERLTQTGHLLPIIRGWYALVRDGVSPDNPALQNAILWPFLRRYLPDRFADAYVLGPESSLDVLSAKDSFPKQLIVYTADVTNNSITLPGGKSLLCVHNSRMPTTVVDRHGVRVMDGGTTLARLAPSAFRSDQLSVEVLLRTTPHGDVYRAVVAGQSDEAKVGRVVGGYRAIGLEAEASNLAEAVRALGFLISEDDPFQEPVAPALRIERSPHAARLGALCARMRGPILEAFDGLNPPAVSSAAFLHHLDEVYRQDSYHSLSIEGYRVTDGLIRRVAEGDWDSKKETDAVNALAARGYFEAFQGVKESVTEIHGGADPLAVVEANLPRWHRLLFQPAIAAGIVTRADLAGYRSGPVMIHNSRHVPPPHGAVMDCMDRLFDILRAEESPVVRAVLGHFAFVYVHPHMDGNGRVARFMLNAFLASGGYPWTTIRVDDRRDYFAALESASFGGDIMPFAKFVRTNVQHVSTILEQAPIISKRLHDLLDREAAERNRTPSRSDDHSIPR